MDFLYNSLSEVMSDFAYTMQTAGRRFDSFESIEELRCELVAWMKTAEHSAELDEDTNLVHGMFHTGEKAGWYDKIVDPELFNIDLDELSEELEERLAIEAEQDEYAEL